MALVVNSLARRKQRTQNLCEAVNPGLTKVTEGFLLNEAGVFDALLVFRLDRLSRKIRELALMVDELTKHDVVLKSITEPEEVMTEGTNPQKKDLLRRLVKKVLVHDKRTIEIWYALPNQASVRTPGHLAPRVGLSTNWRGVVEPQVWFRIIHVAEDGHHRARGDAIREQTVEIALGPKGAFKNGNVGAVTRNVAANRVVSALPEPRGRPGPAKEPKTPRVVELLRKALEWQALLESGEVRNQTEIAQREGITRARVTQVMGLPRLAPEIREHILAMPNTCHRQTITERALRPIAHLDSTEQRGAFQALIRTSHPQSIGD